MAKQISELRSMPRYQLNRINKDELVESILASNEEEGLANIVKKLNDVMTELESLKSLVTSPDSRLLPIKR